MSFVHPYFLWGLLAVSIPIIIHLFNFRRYKKVYFTNVQNLKDLKKETKKKSQLKHLIVLLLRILTIVSLVLAFAQPYIPVPGSLSDLNKRKAVSIYVDNSFSMEALTEDLSLLDKAKNRAIEVAEVYKSSDLFHLLTNDFEGKHQRFLTQDEFKNAVEEIQVTPVVRQLSEVNARQKEMLEQNKKDNRLIYDLSDFQKVTTDVAQITTDSSMMIYLIPLEAELTNNLYIDSCWFESPVQQLNRDVVLKVRIVNNSGTDYEKIPAKLFINGSQKGVTSFDVTAGSDIEIEIPYTNYFPGIQMGDLSLVDYPVVFDDHFYFSYSILPYIPVLSINENGANSYLKAVFGKDSTFLFQNENIRNLDYSTFIRYNLIILNNISSYSGGLAQEIKKFLDNGGSVALFPGQELNVDDFRSFARILNSGYYDPLDTLDVKTSVINVENNLFRDVFENIPRNIDLPSVLSYYPVNIPARTDHEVLLKMQNGRVFLYVQSVGKGQRYMFTAPLDPEFTNLPRHAIFVPAVYNMAIQSESTGRLSYTIGDDPVIEMRMIQLTGDMVFKLKGFKDDFEIIPEHRNRGFKTMIFPHDEVREAGNYRLTSGEKDVMGISFNYNRQESNLDCFTSEELKNTIEDNGLNNIEVIIESKKSFSQVIEDLSIGKRFWKWFVVIALLCLAAEVLILRFW